MKHIDYLYFNIYNYFHSTSQYKESFNVRIQAMYLFALGSGGWLLLMEALYLHLIRHSWFPSRAASTIFAASLYLLTAVLSNYIFIVKDRDQLIFGKYEELFNNNPKRKRHLFISAIVLVIPYLVLLSFAIFYPGAGSRYIRA
jgi:hypothetical protein